MRKTSGREPQLWMSIAMLLIAACIGPHASAGCGKPVAVAKVSPRIRANHSATAIVVAPIAFPLIFVAQPAVFYGYDRRAAADGSRYGSSQRTNSPASGDSKPETRSSASSILARSCVTCHGGTAPKAGLDLSQVEHLAPDQRLKAVARVVSDDPAERMPPGPALSPSDIGRVLQELSQPRSIAAGEP